MAGSVLSNTVSVPSTSGSPGIDLQNYSSTGSVVLRVDGNDVSSENTQPPVRFLGSSGSTSKLAVQGNLVSHNQTTVATILARSSGTGTSMCVQMGGPTEAEGNTTSPFADVLGIKMEQISGAGMSLMDLNGGSGVVNDPAAIKAFLEDYNSGKAKVATPTVEASGYAGVGTCGVP